MNSPLFYYTIKPLIPRLVQVNIRRRIVKNKLKTVADFWPINKDAAKKPEDWNGWPDGKKCAVILTHDIESGLGLGKCITIAEIEKKMDLCSAFNFVPERYNISYQIFNQLTEMGFEIGVHDLNHDGRLFSTYKTFSQRAKRINEYLKQWNACGFRAGSMYHNLDWISELKISYDSSTFDTDPFEPQPDGVNTIFPFIVKRKFSSGTFVELPYTLPQDFLLFILMQKNDIEIWKEKVDWIFENNGMLLVNTHPDYMSLNNRHNYNEYPIQNYIELLEYICNKYNGQFLNLLPKELSILINKKEFQIN
jgi:hypothetical protein